MVVVRPRHTTPTFTFLFCIFTSHFTPLLISSPCIVGTVNAIAISAHTFRVCSSPPTNTHPPLAHSVDTPILLPAPHAASVVPAPPHPARFPSASPPIPSPLQSHLQWVDHSWLSNPVHSTCNSPNFDIFLL
ncbi:hypothetical protein GOP47_0010022 [Adiantum capillus-veneris]|uniref:Uncharacterized protein n=1 Tax=Adiantum capillus-veneris TaxID=13818 RepID=A0A9D4UXN6_ADICA|nr:hypothetical protein GOP47_0010022 [Adiantum capillus-veneris]